MELEGNGLCDYSRKRYCRRTLCAVASTGKVGGGGRGRFWCVRYMCATLRMFLRAPGESRVGRSLCSTRITVS